jgi:UPF0716 family protein affecting phage T7 exclusion
MVVDYFDRVKFRAQCVPTRTRNRAKYCGTATITAAPILLDLPGLFTDLAGQMAKIILPAFRPEKREVRGSMPRPTTGHLSGRANEVDIRSAAQVDFSTSTRIRLGPVM